MNRYLDVIFVKTDMNMLAYGIITNVPGAADFAVSVGENSMRFVTRKVFQMTAHRIQCVGGGYEVQGVQGGPAPSSNEMCLLCSSVQCDQSSCEKLLNPTSPLHGKR